MSLPFKTFCVLSTVGLLYLSRCAVDVECRKHGSIGSVRTQLKVHSHVYEEPVFLMITS